MPRRHKNRAEDPSAAVKIANAVIAGDLRLIKKIGNGLSAAGREKLGEKVSALYCDNEINPLHHAARLGHAEICEYLIKQLKVDANLTAPLTGKTPLFFAAGSGTPKPIETLIECGADLHVKDANGFTPLHDAVNGDCPEAIELLLSKGARVDVQNFTGSPLFLATMHGHVSCLKVLLDHDANPNELLSGIVTPLLIAVMNNWGCIFHPPEDETKEIAKVLIEAGADVKKTQVLHLALHSKVLTELLLKAGADPNLPDESGRLPIEIVAMGGTRKFVEVLFPVTSPIPTVPDWSITGLLSHAATENFKKEMKALSEKRLVDLKQKIEELVSQKEFLAALVLCNYAIKEESEDVSVYYAKRCLCWIHLGNALNESTRLMYMVNAINDFHSSKVPEIVQILGRERLSELMSFEMLMRLSAD